LYAVRAAQYPPRRSERRRGMADTTDYMARGIEVAGKLWGARAGGKELPAQKLAPEFFGLVTQFVFGGLWARPNLDIRSRSLCTVAQLAALGKLDELKGHLAGALNLGIKREELIEVLMQTACYAGVPTAVSALTAAAEVLNPQK
jgi:4-carboxymuconolactone decarboxylase